MSTLYNGINENDNLLTFAKCDANLFVFAGALTNNVPIFVKFIATHINNIYQFEYGPLDHDNKIDTRIIMNFPDTNSIIHIITEIMHEFLQEHKNVLLRFSGSSESRTRLFTRWIYFNWSYMQSNFIMYGYNGEKKWQTLKKNQRVEAVILKLNLNALVKMGKN